MSPTPNADPALPAPRDLLDLAAGTARAAGQVLLRHYGRISGWDTKSSATDPVSVADRESEALVVELLTQARPHDGLIGEEGAARSSGTGLTWVIDPLDGTVNYLYQLDNFSVSIACEDGVGPLVGVVYDPVRDLLFGAIRGEGSWRTDASGQVRRLAVSQPDGLANVLLGTGFGYSPQRRRQQAEILTVVLPRVRDIRRNGSAALELSKVAAGGLDAFYEEGIHRWDIAAGGLIATEAGALLTPMTLTDATTGWVVSSPAIHEQLLAVLRSVGGSVS